MKGKDRRLTFDDFCVLVKDDQKADLIDGVIYLSTLDSIEENDLFGWLLTVLGGIVEEREIGKVYGPRVSFRLDEHQSAESDLAFIRKDREHLIKSGFVEGAPDLAIEIVSPESVDRDYVKKEKQYREAGVIEYWIIDPIEEKVTLLRLDLKGKYHYVKPKQGVLTSEVVPGFWLRPEWLWQQPLPRKTQVLAHLLAEEPP